MSIKGMISSEHNKSLTISIQMLLGIEIARIHCTPDSIWALDKLGQQYYEADFKTFEKELGTNFYGLQALLTNRTFDPEGQNFANFTVDKVEENYVLALNKDMYTEFIVEGGKYLTRSLLKKNNSGSYLMTTYSNFLPVGKFTFPSKVDCIFQSKEKSNTVSLNYSSVNINKKSNLTFSIPAYYRKADMSQLIKLVNGL
jgi:dihydrofolate reductase